MLFYAASQKLWLGSSQIGHSTPSSFKQHDFDHLSARVATDISGNVVAPQGHYPYGESWYLSSTTTKWQFTTYERDAESSNDYAMARFYVNRLGRFSSPDPIAGSPANPQSLNRYPYVRSDPVNLTDPLGLLDCALVCVTFAGKTSCSLQCRASGDLIGSWGPWDLRYRVTNLREWDDRNGIPDIRGPIPGSEYKKVLAKLFQNPSCAALLGGQNNANLLLQNLRVNDVSAPGWTPRSSQQRDLAHDINSGNSVAEVLFAATRRGLTGAYAGGPINVYVGSVFNSYEQSAQSTVLIHELMHVGPTGFTRASLDFRIPGNWPESLSKITANCGTALPPKPGGNI